MPTRLNRPDVPPPCRPTTVVVAAVLAACFMTPPGVAQARRSAEFAYPETRVWTSVVRLVRVDMSSPITEKDKDTGYLLFEYKSDGKVFSGSAEVLSVGDGGQPRVRVVFTVANMPSYVEQMMLDKLKRKLARDFGPPPEARPKEGKPEPAPDGDSDAAEAPGGRAADSGS